MRQIGVLPDAFQARTLADHLLTLRIDTRLEQQPDGCALWVCDEDRVDQAREELAAFLLNPRDPRYAAAATRAEAIRHQEDEVEEDYGKRQTELRELMSEPRKPSARMPFTIVVVIAAVLIAASTRFAEDASQPLLQQLFIAPFRVIEQTGNAVRFIPPRGLSAVAQGEVWRLVTPALIHFNFGHLALDVLAVLQLGGAFELRRGTLRFIAFFILAAAVSNLAQYYFGWVGEFEHWGAADHRPSPLFGGLSGVGYALFGYIWMKSRYEPELGLVLTPLTVAVAIGWFLLCFTGALGPIGNVCHTAGLGFGMLVGAAPTLWRRIRETMNRRERT